MADLTKPSSRNKDERANGLVQESLKCASSCLKVKNYGRAYAHFLLVLQIRPDLKESDLKNDFILSLKEWTEHLERLGRIEDLFKCYDQTCEIFPECDVAMNNIGAQLFRLGYMDEAAVFVRRALKLSPDYLAARENLENICCHLVERWHFRMLNDMTRNRAFRDAIDMAVVRGHQHVLDIGAGTGLLSLFAAEAGASSVFACEQSKTMFSIAQEVLESNSAMFQVSLIPKMSTELTIPKDIPTRVTLITTETFDAGLFGEHIISTLHHAWHNLLIQKSDDGVEGKVIPQGATVYLCAIECETVRKQNRTSIDQKEPYTTEDLTSVRSGYKQLSEPKAVLEVDFNDPDKVDELHSGLQMNFDLEITRSGEVDAIAMWFDLHLDDSITITTAPDAVNCWEQAIFPVQPVNSNSEPFLTVADDKRENLAVKEGDSLTTDMVLEDDCLRVRCSNIKRKVKTCQQSSKSAKIIKSQTLMDTNLGPEIEKVKIESFDLKLESEIQNSQDLDMICDVLSSPMFSGTLTESQTEHSVSEISHLKQLSEIKALQSLNLTGKASLYSDGNTTGEMKGKNKTDCSTIATRVRIYRLSSSDISRLNDMTFHKAFYEGLERFHHQNLGQKISLLDMCSGLSPLGLQAGLLGYSSVTMVTNADSVKEILMDIATVNCINYSILNFTTPHCVMETDTQFDVIVCDLVEPSGVLRQQVLEDLALLRLTSLSSKGIILPHKLTAVGICVESEQLLKTSRVMNKATLGFSIAEFMKEFQASTHLDIDLHTLQYTKLSEPFELFELELNEKSSDQELPSFLQQEKEIAIEFTDSGQFDAVIYWFELQILDEIKLVTVNPCLHWKQAAKILSESESAESGQSVKLNVVLKNSYIDIKTVY